MYQILERLCASFGHDIFDTLYLNFGSLLPPSPGQSMPKSTEDSTKSGTTVARLSPVTHFFVALAYTSKHRLRTIQQNVDNWFLIVIHSLVLFFQVITLNVAVNSFSSSLFALLVSNNFVELKQSVFKRFNSGNLFQLSCSGMA